MGTASGPRPSSPSTATTARCTWARKAWRSSTVIANDMRSTLVDALHGDHAYVRCTLAVFLRLLVDLRLIPALRGSEVLKLKHDQARRPPVPLKDSEFPAADDEPAATSCDRAR